MSKSSNIKGFKGFLSHKIDIKLREKRSNFFFVRSSSYIFIHKCINGQVSFELYVVVMSTRQIWLKFQTPTSDWRKDGNYKNSS